MVTKYTRGKAELTAKSLSNIIEGIRSKWREEDIEQREEPGGERPVGRQGEGRQE